MSNIGTDLKKIRDAVKKNNNEWDLTSDDGTSIVSVCNGSLPVSDLIINKDNEVCVCIPVYHLDWDDIKLISEIL